MRIRDPDWKKIGSGMDKNRIRHKHPGSATLLFAYRYCLPRCPGWVEGLLPYTEKHFQRLSRLQMKSKFLTFLSLAVKSTALPQQAMQQLSVES